MGRRQIDDDAAFLPGASDRRRQLGEPVPLLQRAVQGGPVLGRRPRRGSRPVLQCPVDCGRTTACRATAARRSSRRTSDGITYGYCGRMQCQSVSFNTRSLPSAGLLDDNGRRSAGVHRQPCGAVLAARPMHGRCASDCVPAQKEDWANLGCAKSDGGNDDPIAAPSSATSPRSRR